ncbi:hypothetical protein F5148DRAFT_1265060 [Russula earlei]|uniref:Uncharacterized protein n=1 Tax=Russula earlei TaxID=71964 RepID=A0ACC0TSJ4_9AGAM|nr:hypothetical protein F5148DRAFT_1265060 [Russula earlei]
MKFAPVADVPYRIQSADTDTYLKLRDVDTKTILLQSLKGDDCLEQQWIFVDYDEEERTYRIVNAATDRYPRYLTVDLDTKKVVAVAEDLEEDGDDDDEDDETDDKDDDDDDDDDDGDFNVGRSWLIKEVKGEGVYTIASEGTKYNREIFLIVDDEERASFIEVKASNKNVFPQNRKWRVTKVSGASASDSKSKSSAQTSGSSAFVPDDPSPNDDSLAPPRYHEVVGCPEIAAGVYILRNAGTWTWLCSNSTFTGLHHPGTSISDQVTLTYTDTSNCELTLTMANQRLVSWGDTLDRGVSGMNHWNRWVLERYTDPNGGSSYYICDSSYPQFVITGDAKSNDLGHNCLNITQKRPGYKRHLWKFERHSGTVSAAPLSTVPEPTASLPRRYDGPPPPRYSVNPYPEIPNGRYKLQNVATGEYVYRDVQADQLYNRRDGSAFQLKYINGSAEFELSNGGTLRGPQQINDLKPPSHIALMTNAEWGWNRWAMERQTDQKGDYCYYICDSRDLQVVLSGDIYKNWGGKDYFTIAKKRTGYAAHLWRFQRA